MAIVSMVGGTAEIDRIGLASAFELARKLAQPLTVLSALPDAGAALVYVTSPYMVGLGAGAITQVEQAQRNLVAEWKGLYDALAGEYPDVAANFAHQTQLTERAATQSAVLAEAMVFPRPAGCAGHVLSAAFEAVLMNDRLPVILAGTSAYKNGLAVVAWDGSPQVARAVRMHLPVIKSANRVIIAQNEDDLKPGDQGPATSVGALQDWFANHGVEAETAAVTGPIGAGLLSLCETREADLLVAGAFGHSRAGEFLFGGASRSLLTAETAPALALSH